MRLTSIRLHPFGGISDRTYLLYDGVQVLLGANEYGKSTFRAAVRHALFTRTDLTPAKQRDEMGRWFPISGGNTAAITLKFTHNGSTYTLEKCWGEEQYARLTDQDGTTFRGAREVQDRLDEMRGHVEGSYCRVFEVSQAEIMRTVDELRSEGSEEVNAAAAVMSGTVSVTGDVELESLKQHLEEQIRESCARWNLEAGGPSRDRKTGQGGAERPWKNGVGEVLRSWYDWQDAQLRVDKRETYDAAVDRSARAAQRIEQLEPLVEDCEGKLARLLGRQQADERVGKCEAELKRLQELHDNWHRSTAALVECDRRIAESEKRRKPLEDERANAQRSVAAEVEKRQWVGIQAAHKRLEDVRKERAQQREISDAQGELAESYRRELEECDVHMNAYRLSVRLVSTREMAITASLGTGAPEAIVLQPNQVQTLNVDGELSLTHADLAITVRSANSDLDLIRETQRELSGKVEQLLSETGCAELATVVAAAAKWKAADGEVAEQQRILTGLLQGQTYEQWQKSASETAAIPASRALDVVQAAIDAEIKEHAACNERRTTNADTVKQLERQWPSIAELGERIHAAAGDLREAQREQEKHPQLPQGGDFVASEQARLGGLREELEQARDDAGKAREALAGLGDAGTDDLEALQETAKVAEAKHQQSIELVYAKKRVLEAIKTIQGDRDHFAELGGRVMELFSHLTEGKYSRLRLDTGIPTAIERADGAQLSTIQMSQGTGASLALAVRVALIESLLQTSPLFVLLDDPFVDLDTDRLARAAEVVRELGTRTQVILLTCHPAHAEAVGPARVQCTEA